MNSKVNEIQISYKEKLKTQVKISSSSDAKDILYKHWNKNTIGLFETFNIMLLNNSNMVKGICQISSGGITGTLVDVRILFGIVLKSLSVGVILAHNHPSGILKPSEADKILTQKIKKAAALFDVKILDHLIIIPNGKYYSFADHNVL
ncbi:RadC family protein [uncultured Algibacter sp.]|uniref:JAB domain-containing protein n=1 Tax=uncultured Algibacter sp. TaxID=298659 RepID=UPI002607DD16|nr:JAB domain-containing protein [uncultured Algibacter sp.]